MLGGMALFTLKTSNFSFALLALLLSAQSVGGAKSCEDSASAYCQTARHTQACQSHPLSKKLLARCPRTCLACVHYDNVAVRGEAEQDRSQSEFRDGVKVTFTADLAVDGNSARDNHPDVTCAVSKGLGGQAATWKVDLGAVYVIQEVQLVSMQDFEWDLVDLEVRLEVEEWKRLAVCGKTPPTSALHVQHVPCRPPSLARQVTLRPRHATVLHLCEVKVKAYQCKSYYWGEQCQACSTGCLRGTCYMNGTCSQGCQTGSQGQQCRKQCDCDNGSCDRDTGDCYCYAQGVTYRHPKSPVGCDRRCGHCATGSRCDGLTGHCPRGCQPGWGGPRCDKECQAMRYGAGCQLLCHQCRIGTVCDKVTGKCPDGCDVGFTGDKCDIPCEAGRWGPGCLLTCGHCYAGGPCDVTTGGCHYGCETGYGGYNCKAVDQ